MLFNLGQILATPAAIVYLNRHDSSPHHLIHRHVNGDWGDLSGDDKELNDTAVQIVGRILSAYVVGDEKFYVITEWDRNHTTVMLASEYQKALTYRALAICGKRPRAKNSHLVSLIFFLYVVLVNEFFH